MKATGAAFAAGKNPEDYRGWLRRWQKPVNAPTAGFAAVKTLETTAADFAAGKNPVRGPIGLVLNLDGLGHGAEPGGSPVVLVSVP